MKIVGKVEVRDIENCRKEKEDRMEGGKVKILEGQER